MKKQAAEKFVMIVDDDEMNLQIAKMILERKLDCKVIGVNNGSEAISRLRKQRVCVVLLDIMMPDFDGIETLQEIRADEKLKDIPVMMLTASGEMNDVKKAHALGVTDYIRKPFLPAELIERVSKKLVDVEPPKKVLLVADDKTELQLMRAVLEKNFSCEVATAPSADEAAEILLEEDISLVVAYADMKFVEGVKLLKFIAHDEEFDEIPFVLSNADHLLEVLEKLPVDEKSAEPEKIDEVDKVPNSAAIHKDKGKHGNVVTTAIGYKLDVNV
jgi:CheY-like chemotaxis protein